ncbi:hypothetical protein ACFS07_00325 [Undibacterium arcticum]
MPACAGCSTTISARSAKKPLAAIRKEIEQELERRLKPAAATGAKRLLARYLDYKRALVALEQRPHIAGGQHHGGPGATVSDARNARAIFQHDGNTRHVRLR